MEPVTLHEASNANKNFLALPAEVRQIVHKFYFPADMALKRLAKRSTDFERTIDSKALLNLPPGEGDKTVSTSYFLTQTTYQMESISHHSHSYRHADSSTKKHSKFLIGEINSSFQATSTLEFS